MAYGLKERPWCAKPYTNINTMPKVVFASSFLRDRRIRIGLESHEVARAAGLELGTYRQIECRGQLPEEHFEALATVLNVPIDELRAEKVAVVAESLLGIPKSEMHGFIARALRQRT